MKEFTDLMVDIETMGVSSNAVIASIAAVQFNINTGETGEKFEAYVDLKNQKYTPDFYLPEYGFYIEVKNFMWKYSKIRDEKFREFYPNEILILILKKEYLSLEKEFALRIKNWEYKNSPFPS